MPNPILPSLNEILWGLGAFFALFLLMAKFAYPAVVKMMHDRTDRIRRNLERVRERVGPGVEILAATKYVPVEEMGALAVAGVELVGENRLQDLEAKREPWAKAFEWDFIGVLQSRKVRGRSALAGSMSCSCRWSVSMRAVCVSGPAVVITIGPSALTRSGSGGRR